MQISTYALLVLVILSEGAALSPRVQLEYPARESHHNHSHLFPDRFLALEGVSSNTSSISAPATHQSTLASWVAAAFARHPSRPEGLNLWFGIFVLPIFFMISASDQASSSVVVTSWMLSSIVMNIVNKEAATTFKATSLLVVLQMLAADVVILFGERHKLTYGCWKDLVKWMIIPAFFAGMLSTSLLSLKLISLSTVLVLRNVLPLFAFAVEKLAFDTPAKVSPNLLLAMVVTLFGTLLYARCSISVSPIGTLVVLCNCVLTVADRVLQRSFLKDPDFSVSISLCMLLNNTLGLLPVMAFAVCSGEIRLWHWTVVSASPETWFWVVMSGLCGCALGFLGLRCQQVISATTFLMLQNFNKIALIGIGVLFFGDALGASFAVMGCCVSLLGSIWYGFLRLPVETAESPHLRGKSPNFCGMPPAERVLTGNNQVAAFKLPEAALKLPGPAVTSKP